MINQASAPQPQPTEGSERVIDQVIQDLKDRAEMGKEKYGTYLEAHNGRDPLWDAYQEALDLAMYLRQAIIEHAHIVTCPDCEEIYSTRNNRQRCPFCWAD